MSRADTQSANAPVKRASGGNAPEMRAVYVETLMELAEQDPRIAVVDADLARANATDRFRDRFPERHIDTGVAEANMVGIAAGLSAAGMIPFPGTFSCFAGRRVFDQFFISAAYARLNVKLTGSDPGVSATYNGGTHMAFEDIGLMRTIPALTIYEPSDPVSLRALLRESASTYGSSYLRLHRKEIPALYDESVHFELGKGVILSDGTDVTLIATGAVMVPEALAAADLLRAKGISAAVIDMHTIKPIDRELILEYAEKTGAIVTCENHQVSSGLGSAVSEVLSEELPVPMRRIGVQDLFGEVGSLEYLMERYGLTAASIVAAAEAVLANKRETGRSK